MRPLPGEVDLPPPDEPFDLLRLFDRRLRLLCDPERLLLEDLLRLLLRVLLLLLVLLFFPFLDPLLLFDLLLLPFLFLPFEPVDRLRLPDFRRPPVLGGLRECAFTATGPHVPPLGGLRVCV